MYAEVLDEIIVSKYQILKRLGKGSYGIVWKGMDRCTNEIIAVKKCFDCFQNTTDSQRIFREISLLQQLNGHPNIVRLFDVIRSQFGRDLYMICEYMESDLNSVTKAKLFQPIHIKFITCQLFAGLKYMHSAGVIHRDIKPSNILIDADCKVKICDFGLARLLHQDDVLTAYIATRWYRAPEIILGCPQYDFSVDLWAVGTIVAEMFLARPLFPGSSTVDQLERIIQVTGWPSDQSLISMGVTHTDRLLMAVKNGIEVKALSEIIPCAPTECLDLIRQLIQFSPCTRVNASRAIMHPYVMEFRVGEDESCSPIEAVRMVVDDNVKLNSNEYQEVLYSEVEKLRNEKNLKYNEIMNEVRRVASCLN